MAADLSLLFTLRAKNEASATIKGLETEIARLKARMKEIRTESDIPFKTQRLEALGERLKVATARHKELTQATKESANAINTDLSGAVGAISPRLAGLAGSVGPITLVTLGFVASAAAAGLLGKALFDSARSASEFQGKMFDLSQQTGVLVETLSALEILFATTGGNADSAAQSLVAFQRNLEAAQDPTSKEASLLRNLGVEANNTEQALRDTFAALAKMPEGFTQTNNAAELFGARGGKQVLAVLKESKGDLDGAIERFRELEILISGDTAKAADEFNDQLAIVQFQLRATGAVIARDIVPIVLDVLRDLSTAIRENRDLIDGLATAAGILTRLFTNPLKGAIVVVNAAWEASKPAILAIQAAYEAIATAALIISGRPILPTTKPPTADTSRVTETATTAATSTAATESDARRKLQSELQALRELLAAQTAHHDQEKNLAADRIATAEREFKAGQLTRKERLSSVIENNRQIRDADISALENKRSVLLTEAALASDDLNKRRELEGQMVAIDQKIVERRTQFDREYKDARAEAQKQIQDDELAHQEALLEIATRFDAARIAQIENEVNAGTKAALEGDAEIAQIENAALDREQAFLTRKLAVAGREPAERRKIADEIKKIDADRTVLAQEQEDRRTEIVRKGVETQRDILTGTLDTLLQLERISANAQITSIQALAAARIKTEEDAAREITAIRLKLIDDEIAANRARLAATGDIADPSQRAAAQAAINNQIAILNAERNAIEAQGEREREEGRQRDLENERRYADELLRTRQRIADIQRETAQRVIDLMIIHHARRRDIIRAQVDFDVADEQDRHQRELDSIAEQESENKESNRTAEEKLEREKELNLQREAEAERHRLAMQGITDQGKQDEKEADPLGRLDLDIENLKEFASVIENSIVPLGELLTQTFLQVANAIGQTVATWVLLGETGPAVMRKILAQALASLAAEAAVNAIKELALGFATLFFNPAESAAHFTAAGLWAAIGGVAAVAGRSVAGDLFKPRSGEAGGTTGSGDRGQLSPLTLQRNAGPGSQQFAPQIQPLKDRLDVHITVNDGRFAKAVTATIIDDINNRGPVGEIIANDGNLNRG